MADAFMREVWKSLVQGLRVTYWMFKFVLVTIARIKNRRR